MARGLRVLYPQVHHSLSPNLAKKLECKYSELEHVVLPLLRGRIFHATRQETFDDICRCGWIYSKQQAQLAFAPRQPENSYGRKRGWVSLYDLSNPTDAEIKEALVRYLLLKTVRSESSNVYLIVAEDAWSSLISWNRAIREVGGKEFFIPFVEAWYPGDMPFQLVNESLVVTVRPSPR
jgi:hypothetical protein